jgi:hypothetical protein
MERRRKRRTVEHESLVDRDTIACYKSCSGQTRLDIHLVNGSVSTDVQRRHRMFGNMLKSPTIRSILFCGYYCSVAFEFRRLQILYFLREKVMS